MTVGVNKHRENIEGNEDMEASHKENQHSVVTIDGGSNDTSGEKTVEIRKLKIRARAFTGAFVGMVSPVLLAIVLKKTNLKGVGNYQGKQRLDGSVDLFQRIFPYLAAATLQMGMVPFLCLMVSEACSGLPDRVNHITERLLITSKMVVFFSNILLMFLGCGVLVFIHKNAWYSLLVVSACFVVAVIVILLHICSCYWWYRRAEADNNLGGTEDYHSKLEHSLELSAGITSMMFLVLGSVVLEGLLRSTHRAQPLVPAPPAGMFLAATLFFSFFTSAFAAFLMNVWTIPLVVLETGSPPQVKELPTPVATGSGSGEAGGLTDKFALGLNISLVILAVVVVVLITWEGLQLAAWLILLPPVILLLVLLTRCYSRDGNKEEEVQEKEETKPAPLELTKVTFTGFLALAVPGITTASTGTTNKVFVFCAAAAVVLGLLWRLLTHNNSPSPAVRKAVNHSSFLAQVFLFCAGISFGKMAVNAAK